MYCLTLLLNNFSTINCWLYTLSQVVTLKTRKTILVPYNLDQTNYNLEMPEIVTRNYLNFLSIM